MNENEITLSIKNNQPVISSLQVAADFERQHKNVLATIDKLKNDWPSENMLLEDQLKNQLISTAGHPLNFESIFYETDLPDTYGRPARAYLMNYDGFSLLVMGFHGKKAMEWKLKYIQAFNAMEEELRVQHEINLGRIPEGHEFEYFMLMRERRTIFNHYIDRISAFFGWKKNYLLHGMYNMMGLKGLNVERLTAQMQMITQDPYMSAAKAVIANKPAFDLFCQIAEQGIQLNNIPEI